MAILYELLKELPPDLLVRDHQASQTKSISELFNESQDNSDPDFRIVERNKIFGFLIYHVCKGILFSETAPIQRQGPGFE